jgi:hypothetical protein
MKKLIAILAALLLFVAVAPFASAEDCTGTECTPNPDCPDADSDGICNGVDPDYVPDCDPDCPDADGDGICNGLDPDYAPGTGGNNSLCPDADGDGICNGQDPDYVPGNRFGDELRYALQHALRAMWGMIGLGF